VADGWNGGRRPARGQQQPDADPTRAVPRSEPPRPRAWSQVPPGGRTQQDPRGPGQPARQWDRNGVDTTQYAPRQVPQPYRDQRYRDQPYRDQSQRQQPPGPPRRGGQPAAVVPPARPRRKRRWGRRLGVVALVLLLALGGFTWFLDAKLNRVAALVDYAGRPAATSGTNWLLVGSDSRADLSPEQQAALSTGDTGGSRTDTIMLLHKPSSGASTLVSIPRDSYLDIPGHGRNKVNAAFSIGGPQLLVQTVERATGLRIQHYAEVGFGGFAGVVDAVGGVTMCLPNAIDDPAAGINLAAGCQQLTGAQALGYVRTRHTFANQDLTRIANQRAFLTALFAKASSPSTFLNPFRFLPLATQGVGSLTVDSGDHVWNLAGLGLSISSGDLVNTTVPVGGTPTVPGAGSVVEWDRAKAQQFFGALAADRPLPADLVSGG
jgi:LCP family protein required for cell wall assembly